MFWLSFVVLIINSQIREPIVNVFIFFFKSPGWFQSASSTWLLVVCCCWHSLLPWWSLSSPCETPSTWSGCTHVTWCHKYVTSATPSPVPSTSWSRVWDSKSAPWPNSRTAKRFSHIQIHFSLNISFVCFISILSKSVLPKFQRVLSRGDLFDYRKKETERAVINYVSRNVFTKSLVF